MRIVVFDLDGTLVDTGADLIAAANACFDAMGAGHPLDPVADKAVAFRGGRAMLRLGFERIGRGDEAAVDAHYGPLLEHYGANIDTHSQVYPGAMEAVDEMARAGIVSVICTNKPEGLAETLMARMGLRDAFAALVGADTLPLRKPDPAPFREAVTRAGGDPARALMVGDTETDHLTARAAGVPSVLVRFGPEPERLAELGADAMLDAYADLPDLAERLLGRG